MMEFATQLPAIGFPKSGWIRLTRCSYSEGALMRYQHGSTQRALHIMTVLLMLSTYACPVYADTADQIRIEYVAPRNPAHQHLYEMVQQRRVLERFQKFLSFIR